MSSAMYVFDPVDTPAATAIPGGGTDGYGPNNLKGGNVNKTQINNYAKHIAIAAAVVWAVTKFV